MTRLDVVMDLIAGAVWLWCWFGCQDPDAALLKVKLDCALHRALQGAAR